MVPDSREMRDSQSDGLFRLVVRLSNEFITLPVDQVDAGIHRVLARLGEHTGVDRSYLFQPGRDDEHWSNTHEWTAPGVSRERDNLQDFPASTYPWLFPQLMAGTTMAIPDVAALPPEAAGERAEFEREAIRSLILVPLFLQDKVAGLIGFDSVQRQREWTDREVDLLRVVGETIASALARGRAETSLAERERWLRAIIENEPECVKVVDTEGNLLDMNPAGLRMIEAESLEQVRGRQLFDLVAPEHQDAFKTYMATILRGEKGIIRFEMIGLKGTRRWMETHAVPIRDETSGMVRLLGITRDITEQRTAEEDLRFLANYDPVTGLPNRRLFNDRLRDAVDGANRHGRHVGVAYLDLDRFKTINDTLGHEAGDELLAKVAHRLSGIVRRGDTVARLSGDEFGLIFADMTGPDDATPVCRKLLDLLSRPFALAGRELGVTASLGLVRYPDDVRDSGQLLKSADLAMYQAKEAGRNNCQRYIPELSTRMAEHLVIENELREALDLGQFELHYQPVVSCLDGRVMGAEALLRWRHPNQGLVAPLKFIPLAEETGLIVPIGTWVLNEATRQCAEWRKNGFPDMRIAVNLSARQIRQPDAVEVVRRALQASGLPSSGLDLEVTESLLLDRTDHVSTTLRTLDGMGVSLAIDDFGTGYSSLSYLKRLPIETLKIDRSFTCDIPQDRDDMAIAQAIMTMAQALGLRVVAEGVETAEQLEFLQAHGCDQYQGYYFARPIPAKDFTRLLREPRSVIRSAIRSAQPAPAARPS